jgi:AraC-like DNA-binding protein
MAEPGTSPRELHCRVLFEQCTTIDPRWRHLLINDFWRLYRNDRDGAWIDHAAGSTHLDSGRLYLVPSFGRFRSRCGNPVNHFYVHFTTLGMDGDWTEGLFDRPLAVPQEAQRNRIARMLAEGPKTPTRRLRVQALVAESLAAVIESMPAAFQHKLSLRLAVGNMRMAPVLGYIDQHIGRQLNVGDLAAQCRMSVHHFARVFRAQVGRSPARFLQGRRVALAAECLVAGDDPIEDIAIEHGFANRYHFTRVFTRFLGVPPAAYRRAGRI